MAGFSGWLWVYLRCVARDVQFRQSRVSALVQFGAVRGLGQLGSAGLSLASGEEEEGEKCEQDAHNLYRCGLWLNSHAKTAGQGEG